MDKTTTYILKSNLPIGIQNMTLKSIVSNCNDTCNKFWFLEPVPILIERIQYMDSILTDFIEWGRRWNLEGKVILIFIWNGARRTTCRREIIGDGGAEPQSLVSVPNTPGLNPNPLRSDLLWKHMYYWKRFVRRMKILLLSEKSRLMPVTGFFLHASSPHIHYYITS